MAFLIADSGSTKTHWILVENGISVKEYTGDGMNAYVYSDDQIVSAIQRARSEFIKEISTSNLFFYGAGCSTRENKNRMHKLFELGGFSPEAVVVEHDLMAAARALFNRREGIACILGTGSSSCHIKDGNIQNRLPSLGYIIGDEGGGFDLGSRLLKGVLKGHAPKAVIELFNEEYNLMADEIISALYSSPKPNQYIASFAPFLSKNIEIDYCKDLVRQALESFVKTDILAYQINSPVGFIGSVAHTFRDILKEVISDNKLELGGIIQSPMKGLIEFHNAGQR
ncbi:MAG TPA: hypothetical protein DCX54_02080 [Flavobacteriales bacterium]|nr:hypothetical protein [Flavobacteriales bacterium]